MAKGILPSGDTESPCITSKWGAGLGSGATGTPTTNPIVMELELMGLQCIRVRRKAVSGIWNGHLVVKRGRNQHYAIARMWEWVMQRYRRELRR